MTYISDRLHPDEPGLGALERPEGQPATDLATTPQGASPKATPRVKLVDLLTAHAAAAKDAADLASRCGMPDDLAFRRAVTHYAQGKRVLASYRDKFIKPGDARVYVERHGKLAA